jgi:hypothetical protein
MSAGKDRTSWRGFVSTLVDRCRKPRWPIVALLGWCTAGFFAVILAIQRIELQGHLHIAWGNAPEWLSAIATIAAFGALLFAALTRRAGQAERRSRDADQARERAMLTGFIGQPVHVIGRQVHAPLGRLARQILHTLHWVDRYPLGLHRVGQDPGRMAADEMVRGRDRGVVFARIAQRGVRNADERS